MTDSQAEPGPLLASGRAADVYAIGDGLVCRRYRTDTDNLYEAAMMQYAEAHGYPVPRVVSVCGREMVMERLDGTTMLADFSKHPWRIRRHTKTLAKLLKQLHEIEPAPWMTRKHANGSAVVHLDLHPDNVMITSRGPVVIDWSNAGLGDPGTEVADLWLILACASVPGSAFDRALAAIGRGLLVRGLIGAFDSELVRRGLRPALANRSRDRNMSEVELSKMRALVERSAL